jgi:hypothetical protein
VAVAHALDDGPTASDPSRQAVLDIRSGHLSAEECLDAYMDLDHPEFAVGVSKHLRG